MPSRRRIPSCPTSAAALEDIDADQQVAVLEGGLEDGGNGRIVPQRCGLCRGMVDAIFKANRDVAGEPLLSEQALERRRRTWTSKGGWEPEPAWSKSDHNAEGWLIALGTVSFIALGTKLLRAWRAGASPALDDIGR